MITAHIGETRDGKPCAELRDGDRIVARIYPSPNEQTIRLVMAELVSYRQPYMNVDQHYIDVARTEAEVRARVERKRRANDQLSGNTSAY